MHPEIQPDAGHGDSNGTLEQATITDLCEDTLAVLDTLGPAVLIQHNSTILVPPAYLAEVTEHGNLSIRQGA